MTPVVATMPSSRAVLCSLGWQLHGRVSRSSGLEALAKMLRTTPRSRTRLLELDRACYGGTGWDGAALLALLKDLPRRDAQSGGGGSGLAPLYP
jgi:hypothetical protein